MFQKRAVIFIIVAVMIFVLAGLARAQDPFLVNVEVTDYYGNPIFDEFGTQIISLDVLTPIKVTLNYEVTETAILPCRVKVVIRGLGLKYVIKQGISKTGEYSVTEWLFPRRCRPSEDPGKIKDPNPTKRQTVRWLTDHSRLSSVAEVPSRTERTVTSRTPGFERYEAIGGPYLARA